MRWSFFALALFLANAASAFPEGAPWGAADPDSVDSCSICHFDDDAVRDSAALSIVGLPEQPLPGESYELTIRFDEPDALIAGFQMLAKGAEPAGAFAALSTDIEYVGSAIRSTDPSANNGTVTWRLTWTAPVVPGVEVTLFLAVMGANDDGSPFGDRVHFRSFHLVM